ncbi:hypothetical protein [Limosilactobacillus frumenti]|uniref:hypothetical protein n=1 Tax=Limosilactobacillus frumenti TaxID=104955 RepID=UPI00138F25A8|nr:hypothetical protein [Limosilactobacillus frumenti]
MHKQVATMSVAPNVAKSLSQANNSVASGVNIAKEMNNLTKPMTFNMKAILEQTNTISGKQAHFSHPSSGWLFSLKYCCKESVAS